MSKDITVVPVDYIVKHSKTDNVVSEDADGNIVFGVETEYVPLIRCQECKYWRNKDPQQIPTASIMCGHMHPDDFCSYGEREGE